MARGDYCIDYGCTRNDERQADFYLHQAEADKALAPHPSLVCGKLFVAIAYAHCVDDYHLESDLLSRIKALDPGFDIGKLLIDPFSHHMEDPSIAEALRKESMRALRSFVRRHPGFPFEAAFP